MKITSMILCASAIVTVLAANHRLPGLAGTLQSSTPTAKVWHPHE
jgi:hypothetical protein